MGAPVVQDPQVIAAAVATRQTLITEKVRTLAALRSTATTVAEAVSASRAEHEARIATEVAKAKALAAQVEVAEAEVRALGLELYALDPSSKQVAAGVSVKERSSLSYRTDDALEWARETKMALLPESLDTKTFEKIAKTVDLGFVATIVEPTIQIASDLDKALAAVEVK